MTSARSILVLNCGSSSVKFAVYPGQPPVCPSAACRGEIRLEAVVSGQVSGLPSGARLHWQPAGRELSVSALADVHSHQQALDHLLDRIGEQAAQWGELGAVGHRIVHGGGHFDRPVVIDDAVLRVLEEQVPLAPLHQPHNLAGVRAAAARIAGVPQIACFDTAFHAAQPELHSSFALPAAMRKQGVRRYGFHGLSYQFIAERLAAEVGAPADGRVIVAHLGSGASVCGMLGRRSVRTSMGMTALDGLVMGTRPGSVDIGVALYAITTLGMDAESLAHALYDQSGLLGLSELSADVRSLLASDDPRSAFAIELFCERAAQEIAATAVALGGCEMLVFTAGIGENSPPIRSKIAKRLRWMGLELDHDANSTNQALISRSGSEIVARVMATDEQAIIAAACQALMNRGH